MKKYSLAMFLGIFLLILIGLYLVMSASSTYSVSKFSNQFYLFNNHLLKAGLGIVFIIIFSFIPYELYKEHSKTILTVVITLLVLTLIISTQVKGVKRWLDLGFINFQPADLAKIALFLHLAAMLADKEELLKDFQRGFAPALFWIMLTSLLILAQPNISNGVILILISFMILFLAGARFTHILATLGVSGLVAGGLAMIFTHSRERILTFINSLQTGEQINNQVKQAILGLGSGGLYGVGIGHSSQRNLFLPEAYGDFIFAILGEETGFIGSVVVLSLYLGLFICAVLISKNAKDKFGQLLGISISLMFITYALINASVASGLVPTTGLPLPFISYGGTSMTILAISVGILINIGLSKAKEQESQSENLKATA